MGNLAGITNNDANQNERTHRRVSFVFWLLLAFILIFADQYSKQLAFASSDHFSGLNHIAPFVYQRPFLNYYFAFSLHVPLPVMYAVYGIVLVLVLRHIALHARQLAFLAMMGWILIVAGACSNVFERIWLGSVRDFIGVGAGIFNFADMYITIGILCLLAEEFLNNRKHL
jgi:lipoprotein signal peptidase